MKKMEERRPVMFMWWEVQEKPVPNCQDTKNPMKATWREERRDKEINGRRPTPVLRDGRRGPR